MKAWVLHRVGDLRFEEIEKPRPQPGEVLVRVRAAGICGSDVPRVFRDGAHKMPLVPGHEFAGEVVELGENVRADWLHKRVGVFPLIPCKECAPCIKMQYEMCRNYGYLGSRQDGGFAEFVRVPEWNLIALPDSVTFEQAAMLEPMSVALHAVRRVQIEPDATVAVCGLGTIGMLLTMLLLSRGVKVLAIGNKDYQRQTLHDVGLNDANFCDLRVQSVTDWVKEETNGAGADVFFECVGKTETYAQAVDLIAPDGQVCLVGNPQSDMALDKQVYWKILRNQLRLTGTWNSSFTGQPDDDWHEVLRLLESGRLHPERVISHRLPLEQLDEGLEIMREKRVEYGKVMVFGS